MRFFMLMLLVCGLSACKSIVVKDLDLIRPDNLTGYKTKAVFDQEKLQKILPSAQLKDEQIVVAQAGVEPVTIKGVRAVLPEAKTTVLYFGGNLTHVDENAPILAKLSATCPANFTTFDYRGYGRTNGQPDALLLKEDALRIYDFVRASTSGKLLVYGYSLGGFMASHIAANRSIDGLVLEGSATTPAQVVDAQIPWYFKPFVNVTISDNLKTIDNLAATSQYKGKILVITGGKDTTMPAYLGQQLYDNSPSQEKQYVFVENGTHSNLTNDARVKAQYCELLNKLN
ncbi:alpha/beta hydrolase [Undibacterium macrobrachii]|jgi:pimeloyl-ACP methyl ester carboxylesterase|uniref:Alpha/beta hydrolase n=1 Tax=Undibacterium macrobrachii TaxID=1119058 RepID=A0ABQ2XDC7_9BURK|nr:alpha/beta hydrolase [Undibacterium macrobrachii]GGX11325.1 alpha/beta hydrolase [Undibacterium macrobrachii]